MSMYNTTERIGFADLSKHNCRYRTQDPMLPYVSHIFQPIRRWRDYPYLHAWLRDVYQLPGVAETIDIDSCRRSYFAQLL